MDEQCTSVICADDDSFIRCDLPTTGPEHEHEFASDPFSMTIVWTDEEECGRSNTRKETTVDDEYTPITEVVRDACTIPVEAFNRWLAEVKAHVWDEGYFDARSGEDTNPYRKRMGGNRG